MFFFFFFLIAKLFYHRVGPPITVSFFSLIQACCNCPIDLKLCMMISTVVRTISLQLVLYRNKSFYKKNVFLHSLSALHNLFFQCILLLNFCWLDPNQQFIIIGYVYHFIVYSPKLVIFPRTYNQLPCKGEPYQFNGQRDPLV